MTRKAGWKHIVGLAVGLGLLALAMVASANPTIPGDARIKVRPIAPKLITVKRPPVVTEGTPSDIKVGTVKAKFCLPLEGNDCGTAIEMSICPPVVAATINGTNYICETKNCVKLSESECDCDIDTSSCTTL